MYTAHLENCPDKAWLECQMQAPSNPVITGDVSMPVTDNAAFTMSDGEDWDKPVCLFFNILLTPSNYSLLQKQYYFKVQHGLVVYKYALTHNFSQYVLLFWYCFISILSKYVLNYFRQIHSLYSGCQDLKQYQASDRRMLLKTLKDKC